LHWKTKTPYPLQGRMLWWWVSLDWTCGVISLFSFPCLWTPCLTLQFTHLPTTTDVGGHTLGHIAYYFPTQKTAFVGDSLFALGCGRMFEGTPQQYWTTLQSLRNLPDDTVICKLLDLMCVWFGWRVFPSVCELLFISPISSSIINAYSSLLWCTSFL
jgi:hypothetical protein